MRQATTRLGEAVEIGGAVEVDDGADPGGGPIPIGRLGKGAEERGELGPGRLSEGDDAIGIDSEFIRVSSDPLHGDFEGLRRTLPPGRVRPGKVVIDGDHDIAFPCQAGNHRVGRVGAEGSLRTADPASAMNGQNGRTS